MTNLQCTIVAGVLVAFSLPLFAQTPDQASGVNLQLSSPDINMGSSSRRTSSGRALQLELDEMERANASRTKRIQELLERVKERERRAKRRKTPLPQTESRERPVPRPQQRTSPRVDVQPPAASVAENRLAPASPNPLSAPNSQLPKAAGDTYPDVTPLPSGEAPPDPNTTTYNVSTDGPKSLVRGSVDRLALANNLMVQGNADVAGSIYEELLKLPQTPANLIWIQYQLAACYRMQGDIAKASKLYRHVTSSKDEYWKSRALWWLDYLDRSQRTVDRQTRLQSQMDALRKEVDELKAQ